MKEVYGNLWDFHDAGEWICITTNGAVRTDGKAIMGRGVAEQAMYRYPKLPGLIGNRLANKGNHCSLIGSVHMITFPVKAHWRDKASLSLIERSAKELMDYLDEPRNGIKQIYLPRPGCGNGQLDWQPVRDCLYPILDDRVITITLPANR